MTFLTRSAVLLGAVSAAASLPVLLLVVPAGTSGDLVDRRRLILASQATMLLAAVGAAPVAASAGWLTPWVLIGLLFMIGIGGAVSAPTWQTLQPELVPAADRQQAIALGSVNQNLARAIGPAIGGLLLAATSAAVVFLANGVSLPRRARRGLAATAVPVRDSRARANTRVRRSARADGSSPARRSSWR